MSSASLLFLSLSSLRAPLRTEPAVAGVADFLLRPIEAANGTSSAGAGDLAEEADFVEDGLSADVRKRSGELHSLLLLLVVVEVAVLNGGGGKNPGGKFPEAAAAAKAAVICEGERNKAIESINGLL